MKTATVKARLPRLEERPRGYGIQRVRQRRTTPCSRLRKTLMRFAGGQSRMNSPNKEMSGGSEGVGRHAKNKCSGM